MSEDYIISVAIFFAGLGVLFARFMLPLRKIPVPKRIIPFIVLLAISANILVSIHLVGTLFFTDVDLYCRCLMFSVVRGT